MFCCVRSPRMEEKKPLVVDLNELLCNKAWRNFRNTWTLCQKLTYRRKHFIIEVPDNFFVFETIDQNIVARKESGVTSPATQNSPSKSGSNNNSDGGTDTSGLLKGKIPATRERTNPEVISLDTEFNNDTAEKQTYKFRFEKTRKTEINVSFQKGFTLGGSANFTIGIPVDVGLTMQYQVTKSEGQRFEESMLMEATSDIAVGPNSCYTANVQLEEKSLHANFIVVTRMSMPQGRAPVYIKKKSTGEKVATFYVTNLIDVFGDGEVPCAKEVPGCDDKIDFVVEGVVKGLVACNHSILLSSDESAEKKKQAKEKYLQAFAENAGASEDDGGED